MERKIKFEDAQQLQKQYPQTFEAPTAEDLQQIKPDDFVKVCATNERFWAEVISVQDDVITARVDNYLIRNQLIKYNDIISFNKRNVYGILPCPPSLDKPKDLSDLPKVKKTKKRGKGL